MNSFPQEEAINERQARLLTTLEHLLENPTHTTSSLLEQAIQQVLEVLDADKMDIFFLDSTNETLVALSSSDTPMGKRQRAIGMDRLPLANGGNAVEVFLTGIPYLNNHVDQDPNELLGIKGGLSIKSEIMAVFKVQTQHRGILLVASATPDFFSQQDLRFLEAVARWVGLVVARAELVERMAHEHVEPDKGLIAEELLTLMTHDLRNYLTPLRGRLELIEERARREGREKDRRDAESGLHTLQLLTRSITDMLDIARLNQGIFAINPQPMNLSKVIQEVATSFRSEQVPIHVQTPSQVVLVADPERIRQALEHLLTYAVSQTSQQMELQMNVVIERRTDGPWVLLSVKHRGDVLPQQFGSDFQPFIVDAHSTPLGLGLYLTHQIALAHHGTLTMDSPNDDETWITLALPAEKEELVVQGENESYVPL